MCCELGSRIQKKNSPEDIQDRRIGGGEGGVSRTGNWVLWRRRARRITVPETAMAVAKTTPCALIIEDMLVSIRRGKERKKEKIVGNMVINECSVGLWKSGE